MGAYSPAPVVTAEVHDRIMRDVIEPTLAGMAVDGHPYTGFLYAGLMIDPEGRPKVIEFNCRFGDPETQPIMCRLKSDLVELMLAAIDGDLSGREIRFDDRVALAVVMASGGYPGSYEKGKAVTGLDQVGSAKVFHAGTALKDGIVLTSGGRVLGVTAMGASVKEAQQEAYRACSKITFADQMMRTDIGYRAVMREGE
jgi:phosphoribosylamine--glycine ligase